MFVNQLHKTQNPPSSDSPVTSYSLGLGSFGETFDDSLGNTARSINLDSSPLETLASNQTIGAIIPSPKHYDAVMRKIKKRPLIKPFSCMSTELEGLERNNTSTMDTNSDNVTPALLFVC